ncbi:MAG: response regulator transcription factor [Bacteroidota bacterium]
MENNFDILIVEDERIISKDLQDCLRELGYLNSIVVDTYEAAIEVIDQNSPNIVLLDISLRGEKSGVDIAKYLIQTDTIPFIYITSYTDKKTLEDAKSTRPSGYLVKPFRKEDIFTSIEISLSNFAHRKVDNNRRVTPVLNSQIPFRIKKAINYIHNNYDKRLTLNELSHISEMSLYHFARSFKSYLGKTPYQYIMEQKMERAKVLLISTTKSIIQIGLEVGYDNQSHFAKNFRKAMGQTPKTYRLENQTIE